MWGGSTRGRTRPARRSRVPPDDPTEGVIPRIEAADPNHLVFYEGNYVIDSGLANHVGPMAFPRLVLNFHDYCFLHIPNGGESSNYASCAPLGERRLHRALVGAGGDATAEQPGGPAWLLTEFGATTDAADLARITADADTHLSGWIYWEWINYDDPTGSHHLGAVAPERDPGHARCAIPHVCLAVAGTPTSTSFDPSRVASSWRYRSNPHIDPTHRHLCARGHALRQRLLRERRGHTCTSPLPEQATSMSRTARAADNVTVTITSGQC